MTGADRSLSAVGPRLCASSCSSKVLPDTPRFGLVLSRGIRQSGAHQVAFSSILWRECISQDHGWPSGRGTLHHHRDQLQNVCLHNIGPPGASPAPLYRNRLQVASHAHRSHHAQVYQEGPHHWHHRHSDHRLPLHACSPAGVARVVTCLVLLLWSRVWCCSCCWTSSTVVRSKLQRISDRGRVSAYHVCSINSTCV